MYIIKRLIKEVDTNVGIRISTIDNKLGQVGMLMVVDTIENAKKLGYEESDLEEIIINGTCNMD